MNRQWAQSLGLKDHKKYYPIGMPGYRDGLIINLSDRQYEVVGPSWRLVQMLPEPHEFPAIIRDTRHVSKPYPPKHPAVLSEKGLAMRAAAN